MFLFDLYRHLDYDLHIYFKEHRSEAMDIQRDKEEEFMNLEYYHIFIIF